MSEIEKIRTTLSTGTDGVWWSYRFIEAVLIGSRRDEFVESERETLISCLNRLAAVDPRWLIDNVARWTLPNREMLPAGIVSSVVFDSERETALFRAEVLLSSARWRPQDEALLTRAWEHLAAVPVEQRDERWTNAALQASVVDYAAFRRLVEVRLGSGVHDVECAPLLSRAIEQAYRRRDRVSFDAWIRRYWALPVEYVSDDRACGVLNVEGLWALDEARMKDAENLMKELLELVEHQEFHTASSHAREIGIANLVGRMDFPRSMRSFPSALRSEGQLLPLCDRFDAIVSAKGWEILRT